MATLKQTEANRLNAQKSTGPRSPEGKAVVRFNALKSGIDAKSQVIPGEDPAALELLTAEYHERFQPATPEVRALVDALVTAEWLQRRFRTLEAQLWNHKIHGLFRPVEGLQVAQSYDNGSDTFDRLQRRIDAAERSYHRTLVALQKIESRGPQPSARSEPEPLSNQPPGPEIGFVPSTSPEPSPFDPVPAGSDPRPPAPDSWPRERSERP
jgi:hypothetical protein